MRRCSMVLTVHEDTIAPGVTTTTSQPSARSSSAKTPPM